MNKHRIWIKTTGLGLVILFLLGLLSKYTILLNLLFFFLILVAIGVAFYFAGYHDLLKLKAYVPNQETTAGDY